MGQHPGGRAGGLVYVLVRSHYLHYFYYLVVRAWGTGHPDGVDVPDGPPSPVPEAGG